MTLTPFTVSTIILINVNFYIVFENPMEREELLCLY